MSFEEMSAETKRAARAIQRAFGPSTAEQMGKVKTALVDTRETWPWYERDWFETWLATTVWMRWKASRTDHYEAAGCLLLLLPIGVCIDGVLAPLRMLGRRA